MKKLLSVVLLAVMLLGTFTLTGCDATLASLHNIIVLLTPTEAGPAVTTITEAEWLAAMECSNFSATGEVCDDAGNSVSTGRAATNSTVMYQYQQADTSEKEFYFATIDDVQYQICKEESGYVAYKYDGGYNTPTVGDMFPNISYSDLVYSEETKSYKYETENAIVEVSFENGNIKNLTYTQISANTTYNLFDFGTTVVELPEYTFASTDSQ